MNRNQHQDKNQISGMDSLRRVLADTFVLYMKTYAVHWNYTGTKFFSVHKLTETQYQELAEAIDEIAERIRALEHEAPISLSDILDTADLKEFKANGGSADDSLHALVAGHELLSKRATEAAAILEKESDMFSNDMMVGRIGSHDKAAWMLKSFLAGR